VADVQNNAATVLLVEDHPDMRRYLCEVLSAEYRCLASGDGVRAVSLACEELPDVVVCDVLLPGQDGMAVCRALRNDVRTSHIPVVLLTALADDEHRVAGLTELADDYLAKPVNEAELRLRLRNLLDLRAMLQRRCAREIRFEREVPADLGERDRVFLGKLGRVVARRYGEVGLDLGGIAAEMALSERQLQRKLKALTGLTPGEYLRDYRLVRSYEQLSDGRRANEVARDCGFVSAAHFATCFRARFGHVPSETRARSRRRA
jgi:DNA-binding response OmpR family regulator